MKKIVLLMCTLTLWLFGAADAKLTVIKKLSYTPKIGISLSDSSSKTTMGSQMAKMLVGDFKVSSHFKAQMAESPAFDGDVNYFEQKDAGYDLLLKVNTSADSQGIQAEMKLYDINANQMVLGKRYTISRQERYPFLAHKIAIDVNDYINAPSISWMQNFVVFSRSVNSDESEILISDYTLTFKKTVIKDGHLNVFPKWASSRQEAFYYTSYADVLPTLYRFDIYTGEKQMIAQSEGMLVCSDVSEDGSRLLLTMAPDAQPDIYLYDTQTGGKSRVTKYSGIDVSGQFIEHDSRVIFVSDRLGHPNIFAKTIGDDAIEQMVYHGKNNNACSSHEDLVVYSSRESNNNFGSNTFNLYMVSTKSDMIRRLSAGGVNQFPKFSADGETILFLKHFQNQSALGIIRWQYNKSYLFPLNAGKIQSIDW